MNFFIDEKDSKRMVICKLLWLVPLIPFVFLFHLAMSMIETTFEFGRCARSELKEIHDRLLRIED